MPNGRYLPHGPFHAALEQRVAAHFASTSTDPHGPGAMRLKTALIVAWWAASYAFTLLVASSAWQVALGAASIGLAMAAIGFNVQHDGSHLAYSKSSKTNAFAAAMMDFIGASSYVWAWKHNVFHHANPNRVGLDADIDIQPFCRLAPAQRWHPWQRFQHVYIWFLYSLLAFKWLFDDFRDIANGAVGGRPIPRPKGAKLAQFVAGKLFFLGWSFVLPVVLFPVSHVVAAWLLGSVVLSLTMALVFQAAHVVERVTFPENDGTSRWAEHQVATTADFAQGSRLITWLIGGLNFQIEHHLFPRICHVHLPAIAPIVKATCAEFDVPYRVYPTALGALVSHARWVRKMGAAA